MIKHLYTPCTKVNGLYPFKSAKAHLLHAYYVIHTDTHTHKHKHAHTHTASQTYIHAYVMYTHTHTYVIGLYNVILYNYMYALYTHMRTYVRNRPIQCNLI